MAALVRYAMVNPYWNVPPDLVMKSIAPRVLEQGLGYFVTYLTAGATAEGLVFRADPYQRDPAVLDQYFGEERLQRLSASNEIRR